MTFVALLQTEVAADPTGGLLPLITSVGGSAGAVALVVWAFLKHIDRIHDRNKALLERVLGLRAKVEEGEAPG